MGQYLNIFQQVRYEIRGINIQFLRLIWDRICLRKPLSVLMSLASRCEPKRTLSEPKMVV